MFQKAHIILLFVATLLLGSCSDYNKVLKSSDYEYKLKRANQYFDKQSYIRALPLYEELMTIYRGTTKAEEIGYRYGSRREWRKDVGLAWSDENMPVSAVDSEKK